ncbi:MAG: hypothetical protein AB7G80_05080 [Dongiaceae bacterium]
MKKSSASLRKLGKNLLIVTYKAVLPCVAIVAVLVAAWFVSPYHFSTKLLEPSFQLCLHNITASSIKTYKTELHAYNADNTARPLIIQNVLLKGGEEWCDGERVVDTHFYTNLVMSYEDRFGKSEKTFQVKEYMPGNYRLDIYFLPDKKLTAETSFSERNNSYDFAIPYWELVSWILLFILIFILPLRWAKVLHNWEKNIFSPKRARKIKEDNK